MRKAIDLIAFVVFAAALLLWIAMATQTLRMLLAGG